MPTAPYILSGLHRARWRTGARPLAVTLWAFCLTSDPSPSHGNTCNSLKKKKESFKPVLKSNQPIKFTTINKTSGL